VSYRNLACAKFPGAVITGFGRYCLRGIITGNCWLFSERAEAEKRLTDRTELIDLTPDLESQLDLIPDRDRARR